MAASVRSVLRHLWAWRTVMILFLTPVVLLPIPILLKSKEASCGYVIIMMAVYWITESIPVAVTALLPVALFPVFGILSSDAVAATYMNDSNMLFMGGLMIACAIEYWDLHKRVALGVLMLVGSNPRWLMLGMMGATWCLSMWISNTATTAMMIPIAEAVLVQLKNTRTPREKDVTDLELHVVVNGDGSNGVKDNKGHEPRPRQPTTEDYSTRAVTGIPDIHVTADATKSSVVVDDARPADDSSQEQKDDPNFTRMCKGFSLSICYAANSGGIGSLTGTGPNLALKAHADSIYQVRGLRNPVTFGSWMAFGLPLAFVVLIVCWVWLQIAYVRQDPKSSPKEKAEADKRDNRIVGMIRHEYRKLGPLVSGQVIIIILFLVLVTLWITRDLGGVAGWGRMFHPPVKDGCAAIFIAILLFVLPSTVPCLKSYTNYSHPSKWERQRMESVDNKLLQAEKLEIKPVLYWTAIHDRMPWHLFLLLGGGYAMSKGCQVSGLSKLIGHKLEFLAGWNQWAVLFVICSVTSAATEVTSNTAIATLMMPIMSQLAIHTGVHPLYYMFPAALSCSFSFMLPVATPPNAIVFAYGRIKIMDMISTGLLMNILCVPILIGVTATVGDAVFSFSDIPAEFLNSTLQ